MKQQSIDAVFVSSLCNITYLTGFSGFSKEDRDAFLLITHDMQIIFTHGIYKDAVAKYIKKFELIEMKRENPVSKSLKSLIAKHHINKLGVENFDLRVSEYERLLKLIKKKIIKSTNIVNKLRIIKEADEIEQIKKSCALGDKVYSQVLKNIRIGITEKELALEIDHLIRKNVAEPSFPTIVAFGENASFPHHVATVKKLTNNTIVLMDFGVKIGNYCSDMTRTVFFGKAGKEQTDVYQTVLNSQQQAIDSLEKKLFKKSKIKASAIDRPARDYIVARGYPSIPHSLGHGIGLEVHELPHITPNTDELLENGMVFSIEPGIYLPDKMGVRIEDLFAIEDNNLVPLTHSPKELIEI